MTYDPNDPSLQRLERLDHRYHQPPPAPSGSPGMEMLGAIIFPGLSTARRRPGIGFTMFLLGVVAPVGLLGYAFLNRANLVGFALNPRVLLAIIGLGIAFMLTRLLSIVEIANSYQHSRGVSGKAFFSMCLVLLLSAPVMWGVYKSNEARAAVGSVFAGGSSDPIYDGGSGGDIRNVVLLGSDSGPGRWGARTDTMIVAMIHQPTGRMALVSIPRNLRRLQFPPGTPMADAFPNGFNEYEGLANAVFTYLDQNPQIRDAYARDGLLPQAVALSEGIGYSLGISIDDYALVNMAGFADIIDAVGGVDINLPSAIPLPPVEGAQVPPSVGPGLVHMDGDVAIAYVRSRQADSDYARMGRQRELLAALGTQVSPTDAATGFGQFTGALDESMRTSLTATEFSDLLNRMGDSASIGESVGLNPPLVNTGDPNYDEIRGITAAVQNYVRTGTPSGFAG